ncbi:Mitochondrial pyruvate carrier 3 [Gracilariopsis chorda]|uniref:Mitochondrial pyruvate carrier n=1 Tax=Gracilariopsis chorda TaxID=448386 RepID=A0A2V3IXC8_9FLOR|nr:Mitochondrial pyruvate carrier 3 [Gracilariopsis chorda]|eukprot:PXF46814.1 Mitochondrial pyruvate carrier 3 [Gracilariopsis chorda]
MAAARLRALWEHPAGLKTVFFWAPTMKWGLVYASLSDMKRPVENVSIPQCTVLAMTGMVWTRYSFVIHPINYNLAGANVFVALTNLYQLSRVVRHSGSKGDNSLPSSATSSK